MVTDADVGAGRSNAMSYAPLAALGAPSTAHSAITIRLGVPRPRRCSSYESMTHMPAAFGVAVAAEAVRLAVIKTPPTPSTGLANPVTRWPCRP